MTTLKNLDDKYDVIIIGAGIGGLTCGCYLAKAGMKVLIVEKNDKPGGYCTSFKRDGYTFDTAVRGLIGCSPKGILGRIIKDLGIDKAISIKRLTTFDMIFGPDFKIGIKNNPAETKEALKHIFKKESKNIENFFDLISTSKYFNLFLNLRNKTFQEFINEYFDDYRIKTFWNFLRLDTGLSPNMTSALAGFALCRGYLLDGGYYPEGGMQKFSNCFARIFEKLGGKIVYSSEIVKIKIDKPLSFEVVTNNDLIFKSEYVVSNCDATHTFTKLIDEKFILKHSQTKLKKMIVSPPVFIVYLGLKKSLKREQKKCCALWSFSIYPREKDGKDYDLLYSKEINYSSKYFICLFSSFLNPNYAPKDCESICLYIGAPYNNKNFWEEEKNKLADDLIGRASKVISNLRENIVVQEIATPITLQKYTLNREGASRGWASIPSQTDPSVMPPETHVPGLYLAGHWTTSYYGQGGIAMAAYSGKQTAKLILKKSTKNENR